jgi:hypothetical protein
MDSQLSNALEIVGRLRESARRGDWKNAADIATTLPQQSLPDSADGVGEYLRNLKDTLTIARVSRAHTAASLVRLKAAARFNHARCDLTGVASHERQYVGDPAGS